MQLPGPKSWPVPNHQEILPEVAQFSLFYGICKGRFLIEELRSQGCTYLARVTHAVQFVRIDESGSAQCRACPHFSEAEIRSERPSPIPDREARGLL
jgi:hypothetical protein